MRFLIRLLVFLFVTLPIDFAAHAQITAATASRSEDEDLRQTVRELALRVSALEAELHRQRSGTPTESASLKPAALVLPSVDVRSSVESVSSTGVTEAPVAAMSPQVATTQKCGRNFGVADVFARRGHAELHVRWVLRV